MDFIKGLPKSIGKSIVLVVVDGLAKYAQFISLSHPNISVIVTQLFLANVYKLHSVFAIL